MSDVSPAGTVKVAPVEGSFRHAALFYSGEDEFLRGTLPFIADALDEDEPLVIAASEARTALLKRVLGERAEDVHFTSMRVLARNPARMIPAWREVLSEHARDGRPVRAIGEPVWAGRSDAELSECERSEALLNVAFAEQRGWSLMCAYDVDALDPSVIEAARLSHPIIALNGIGVENDSYPGAHRPPRPFDGSLPDPAHEPERLAFTAGGLGAVRNLVSMRAAAAGLGDERREDLVLAVNELATNSVQYGGGGGTLATWTDRDVLLCEVRDRGHIEDPLIGRLPPPLDRHGGRGLWLVHQLCDLVQIRSSPSGSVVRVQMRGR
jgi:anti-sigma regulatory factor (Ser/Thr protein kinase)